MPVAGGGWRRLAVPGLSPVPLVALGCATIAAITAMVVTGICAGRNRGNLQAVRPDPSSLAANVSMCLKAAVQGPGQAQASIGRQPWTCHGVLADPANQRPDHPRLHRQVAGQRCCGNRSPAPCRCLPHSATALSYRRPAWLTCRTAE